MRISAPQTLSPAVAQLGEGPAWDATRHLLWWVDILPGILHAYEPLNAQESLASLGQPLGCLAPCSDGKLVAGLQQGLAFITLQPGEIPSGRLETRLQWIARPESSRPRNRFNDGKASPEGRFLAGTMDMDEIQASGALYCLDRNGALRTLLGGVRISNGLTWSPQGDTLYYIDTPTRLIRAFDYDPGSGNLENPRDLIALPPSLGWPDGMTSDQQGRLWVALWGGAALTVWDPRSASLVEKIPLPAKNITSCCFGGPDLSDLYITTARQGLTQAELQAYPLSGALLRLQTNVSGCHTWEYQHETTHRLS